jgi:DNA-directed RNA polymerase specialized sigma24 family protein
MAPRRTIYVRDEDQELWSRAESLAGTSLSRLLTTLLRQFVEEQEKLERLDLGESALADAIEGALRSLSPKLREVLLRRCGIGDGIVQSHEEIATTLGMTSADVKSMEAEGLRKLRRHLNLDGLHPDALSLISDLIAETVETGKSATDKGRGRARKARSE